MTEHEKFDYRGVANWMERLQKADPTFDMTPTDFGVVGDGVTDDSEALRSYQQYLEALKPTMSADPQPDFP